MADLPEINKPFTVESISVGGLELSPSFTQNITYYSCTTYTLNTVLVKAKVRQFIDDPEIVCTMTLERTGESKTGFSNTFSLEKGDNKIRVDLAYSSGTQQLQSFRINVKKKLGNGLWPIQGELLPPGFYGGTYIPNWRTLKMIFLTGSGKYDFENAYNTLAPENEKVITDMNNLIFRLTRAGKLDSLVESFIHYSGFVNTNWEDNGDYSYYLPIIQVSTQRPTTLRNGYVPKNNKLFAFPYCSLKINGYGSQNELKYELFPEKLKFGIVSHFQPGSTIQLYPISYDGIRDNFDFGANSSPLPVFAYSKQDALNAWNSNIASRNAATSTLNETKNVSIIESLSGIITNSLGGVTSGFTTGSATGSVAKGNIEMLSKVGTSLADGIMGIGKAILGENQGLRNFQSQLLDAAKLPPSLGNQNASPEVPMAMKNAVVPYITFTSIRQYYAEKIDEYFTRYGYKVSRVGVPNLFTRQSFNFIKLNDPLITGELPEDEIEVITQILEKGITFWHSTDVGNYALPNNAPITENPRYSLDVDVN